MTGEETQGPETGLFLESNVAIDDATWLKELRATLPPRGWSQFEVAQELAEQWFNEAFAITNALPKARPEAAPILHRRLAEVRQHLGELADQPDLIETAAADIRLVQVSPARASEIVDTLRDFVVRLRARIAAVESGRTRLKPALRRELLRLRDQTMMVAEDREAEKAYQEAVPISDRGNAFNALKYGAVPRETTAEVLESIEEVQSFVTFVPQIPWKSLKLIMTVNHDHGLWPLIGAGEIVVFAHGILPYTGHLSLVFDKKAGVLRYGVLHVINSVTVMCDARNGNPVPFVSDDWIIYGHAVHREFTLEHFGRTNSPFFYRQPDNQTPQGYLPFDLGVENSVENSPEKG